MKNTKKYLSNSTQEYSIIFKKQIVYRNILLAPMFCFFILTQYGCDGKITSESKQNENNLKEHQVLKNDTVIKGTIIIEEEIPESEFFKNIESNDTTFKAMKARRVIVFDLSSEDPDSLGLIFIPEAQSIEAIKIVNDFAYLSDAVHGNIKKICLQSGSMISGNALEKDRFEYYLQEIAFYKDLLYVITHRNKIFRLTLELEYVDSFFIPDSHWNKNYLYSDQGEKLIIFSDGTNDFIVDEKTRPSEYVIDAKTKIFQRRLHIDDQLNFSYDTLSFKNHIEYREWITTLRGEKIEIDGKHFYLCNDTKYEIPTKFLESNYFFGYGASFGRNIDCSDQYLAFFEISLEEEKLYLHVYEYLDPSY